MSAGRTWRGGQGSASSARSVFVASRPDRYTFENDVLWECSHPYCDVVVQPGALIYRSRNRDDAWYCSKVCRERHVRILVQQRRRSGTETRQRDRDMQLQRKYGLEPGRFEELYSLQMGRCAVCHEPLTEGRETCVDHDHACCSGPKSCGSCVRGLLCSSCNGGLGFFNDDASLMHSAINYLTQARESAPAVRTGGGVTTS